MNQLKNQPLNYIERISSYYQALGYGAPYRWASFEQVPFTPLGKPLRESVIGIVTTAAPFQPGRGEQGPGAPYNGSAKFFEVYSKSTDRIPDLCISHIAYDRAHTHARDLGSYFPLAALRVLQAEGVFAALAPRFHGLPTDRSQTKTTEIYCVELVKRCLEDSVDAVVLVPNCPVCHQSVSLAARALESAGIASVIMGCARDIVECVGVPRLLFNNFPLGNSAGLPDDPDCQRNIAALALELLEQATHPRTTWQSPYAWSGDPGWQLDYSNAAILSAGEIAKRRAAFDQGKAQAREAKSRKNV